ncbi:MAG: L,D-transpeptidase [Terriglobia bacterium]
MRGIAKRHSTVAGQMGCRVGLFLGALTVIWSAQLLGTDLGVMAPRRDENEDAPRPVLVISVPDRKLAVMEEGRILKVYPVAVGAAVSPSPTGTLRIINKVIGPTYYHKGKVIAPGKSNPLGDRWMGLSQKGYGIHGTNAPSSIGKAASHGCIRMGKHDVEELFNLARVGDAVEIHGERDTKVAAIFGGGAVEASASTRAALATSERIAPQVMTAMAEEAAGGE